MAYPEAIPDLKGQAAKEFLKRLDAFTLTASQKELYRNARETYRKKAPK